MNSAIFPSLLISTYLFFQACAMYTQYGDRYQPSFQTYQRVHQYSVMHVPTVRMFLPDGSYHDVSTMCVNTHGGFNYYGPDGYGNFVHLFSTVSDQNQPSIEQCAPASSFYQSGHQMSEPIYYGQQTTPNTVYHGSFDSELQPPERGTSQADVSSANDTDLEVTVAQTSAFHQNALEDKSGRFPFSEENANDTDSSILEEFSHNLSSTNATHTYKRDEKSSPKKNKQTRFRKQSYAPKPIRYLAPESVEYGQHQDIHSPSESSESSVVAAESPLSRTEPAQADILVADGLSQTDELIIGEDGEELSKNNGRHEDVPKSSLVAENQMSFVEEGKKKEATVSRVTRRARQKETEPIPNHTGIAETKPSALVSSTRRSPQSESAEASPFDKHAKHDKFQDDVAPALESGSVPTLLEDLLKPIILEEFSKAPFAPNDDLIDADDRSAQTEILQPQTARSPKKMKSKKPSSTSGQEPSKQNDVLNDPKVMETLRNMDKESSSNSYTNSVQDFVESSNLSAFVGVGHQMIAKKFFDERGIDCSPFHTWETEEDDMLLTVSDFNEDAKFFLEYFLYEFVLNFLKFKIGVVIQLTHPKGKRTVQSLRNYKSEQALLDGIAMKIAEDPHVTLWYSELDSFEKRINIIADRMRADGTDSSLAILNEMIRPSLADLSLIRDCLRRIMIKKKTLQ